MEDIAVEVKKYDHLKDRLISLYASDDDLKEKIQTPNDTNDNWWVSDGYIAIVIPHEFITPAGESKINFNGVFPKPLPEPKLFTLESFKRSIEFIPSEPDYFYTYTDCIYSGCKRCDYMGTHTIKGKKNGQRIYSKDEDGRTQYVKLGTGFFDPTIIHRVISAIKLFDLDLSIIQLTHNSFNKASIIIVGHIQILFMPCLNPNENDFISEIE